MFVVRGLVAPRGVWLWPLAVASGCGLWLWPLAWPLALPRVTKSVVLPPSRRYERLQILRATFITIFASCLRTRSARRFIVMCVRVACSSCFISYWTRWRPASSYSRHRIGGSPERRFALKRGSVPHMYKIRNNKRSRNVCSKSFRGQWTLFKIMCSVIARSNQGWYVVFRIEEKKLVWVSSRKLKSHV